MNNNFSSVLIMASVRWYNTSAHYALHLAGQLKNAGIKVVIFGIPGSPIIEKATSSGIQTISTINLMNCNPVKYLINLLKFRKFIIQQGFDVINPHISRDHTFIFLSSLLKRISIIRTRTDSIPPKQNLFNRIFYRNSAQHYTVSSKFMTSHLKDMGVEDNQISVIPLEINYKEFSNYTPAENLKTKLNIPDGRVIVSFIGRLDIVKGVEYLVKSFPLLKNKNRIHYIISGEEINLTREYLNKIAQDLNIDNISFIDRLDDARELLSITDIGVIPSVGSEAICRIALEMISFGIPVIGTSINSIPETILGFKGTVVSPRDPEEIAKAIDSLFSNENYKKKKNEIESRLLKQPPDKFTAEFLDLLSKAAR